jgi:hypothetical protein
MNCTNYTSKYLRATVNNAAQKPAELMGRSFLRQLNQVDKTRHNEEFVQVFRSFLQSL